VPISNPGALLRAKQLRHAGTPAEDALWERLRDRQFLDLKFRRQVPIRPYVADFYCHERKIVVELDGGIHATTPQKSHDENRDANLAALGYKVLRLTNDELSEDLAAALEKLRYAIERRKL